MDIEKLKADMKAAFESGRPWDKPMWHERLHDWETFDKITMEVVPRYKTSGMSGDEWRFGTVIKLWFKGHVVHEDFRTSMEAAIRYLPVIVGEAACPISTEHVQLDEQHCDNPGCGNPWVARYVMKRRTAANGLYLADEEMVKPRYRKFCKQHLRRGDCSREDADDNYIPLDGIGPDDAGLVIESPSAFGGAVQIDAPAVEQPE